MGDAIFKQKSGTLGVGIVTKCGVITPQQLMGIGKLAEKLGSSRLKMTTRQTLIVFIDEDKLEDFRNGINQLGLSIGVFGEVVRNVKACAGNASFCLRANSDVFRLAGTLQDRYMNQQVPRDFKISLAGCYRSCTDPLCADFGVIATGENRFSVYLGGRGGSKKPVHAVEILKDISETGVEQVLDFVLKKYRETAEMKERLCTTIERVGLETFMPSVGLIEKFTVKEEEDDFLNFAGL